MVEKLKEEHAVDVEWRPFYLYFNTPPEGRELPDHVKRARANGSEERLRSIANSYGMEFVSTKRIYNTRLAHEATEYAREHGMGNEFHRVVFRKVYAEEQDISQWDVLRAAAEEVGLNADEMQREVESEKYTADAADQVRWAYQIGVTGVPTYVINNRYAIVGAQPYEVFKNALGQIGNQKD
ncbi:MAG: DsbA family oxidoreductase [Anaerolineae bacterium]|nr:DsbA family oxidoreductase [Anaerolineae bacterium]MCI0607582.1 DsbA family oxidoreductase [Anaerolineae bacterium]